MISKLLRSRRIDAPRPAVPEGRRIYAVGDIHGCVDLLDELLCLIEADDAQRGPAETTLIFLGDVVDRGPASAAVLDRLLTLQGGGRDVQMLMGNHEEVFLGALDGEPKALRLFCRIGGRETAMSYGIDATTYDRMDYDEFETWLASAVPAPHRALLATMKDMVVIGDYVFVHAGIRPGRALAEQRPSDLRWIRDPFLDHGRKLEKVVVHGHTATDEVTYLAYRIGIDTGAYFSGRLTALGLEADQVWTLATCPAGEPKLLAQHRT